MQGIERAQGMTNQAIDQLASDDRVTVNQRLNLEIATTNIGCEISQGGARIGGIDLAGATPPLQEAAELDYGEPTDPCVRPLGQKRIEIIRASFINVPL